MNSHYLPLQAYQDRYYASSTNNNGHHRLRRSNPQIHYATELVLTPKQAQQIQQSLVNRYATIGRNYHINVGCDQTAVKADVHHRPPPPPPPSAAAAAAAAMTQQPQPPHNHHHRSSHDNLAMRINNNLISHQNLTMKRSPTLGTIDFRRCWYADRMYLLLS
jgi:hypothetical protein